MTEDKDENKLINLVSQKDRSDSLDLWIAIVKMYLSYGKAYQNSVQPQNISWKITKIKKKRNDLLFFCLSSFLALWVLSRCVCDDIHAGNNDITQITNEHKSQR